MQERLEAAKEKATRFEKLRGRLDRFTASDVASTLKLYESIIDDLSRTTAYSYMRYSADTADQQAARAKTAEEFYILLGGHWAKLSERELKSVGLNEVMEPAVIVWYS